MNLPDRYELLGKAMDGGMSSVFPYRDKILKRKVALKIVPPGPNEHRINDELTALFKMRSKHVVQVYDVFKDATSIGVLQEYIDGEDLFSDDFITLDPNSYLKTIWQIAAGISDIHEAGLIHRDIKPNNMKIDGEGILKIFDFGLARDDGPNAATVGFVGTHGFAAPELYSTAVQFTKGIDTYAFGATALYFGLRNIPTELKTKPPIPLATNPFTSLPFTLPAEIADILGSCLEHSPQSRPNMADVKNAISRHLSHDKHRALVVNDNNGKFYYLDSNNRTANLSYGVIASVEITYDGFYFSVTKIGGDVYINNARANVGGCLPGACVLTLGAPELKSSRAYITFDLAHPEIVL